MIYRCVYIYIYIYKIIIYIYTYIYIYIYQKPRQSTANPRTDIMDFRGFDSSMILILRGGISRPIGNFPQSLTQAMLVGIMLVGGLGV